MEGAPGRVSASAPPRAALPAKKWHRQEPPSGLVGDFQLDIAGIAQLVAQFLDRRERFRARRIDVGKLDALVILVKIVAVADVEEKRGMAALGFAR